MPITQETGEFLFLIMMFTAMGGLLWLPTIWALLTFFTPKKLLETYFKEPHFSQGEIIFMSQFPLSFFRTVIFGWVILVPSRDKNRNIRDCYKVMPAWYRLGLKLLIISSMLILFVIGGIMLFLLFFSHVVK